NSLKNLVGIFPKGWRVAITYRRDGKNLDTYVRLMGVHTEAELLAKMEAEKEEGPDKRKPKGEPPHDHPSEPKQADEPKPDKQPNDKPQPGDGPKLPKNPSEELDQAVRAPVPEELKKEFEARTGYANFYFNRENLQRVWKAINASGDF